MGDLQNQIQKAQDQYEKAKSLRIAAEGGMKEKEEVNVKLKERIEQMKKLIEKQSYDPELKAKCEQLQKKLEDKKKLMEDKNARIQQKKQNL